MVGSLAEAFLRWDAMAPPVRIIFRLIGTGKLTAGEIFEAVRPEIANGALTYPLCVFLCAFCGLWGLLTILFRRRGFAAAAMYLCAAVLTVLSGGGTALRTVHVIRCVMTAAAGCLYAVRAFMRRPPARRAPDGERGRERQGEKRESACGAGYEDGKDGPARGGRLFGAVRRRPLFGDEEERTPLFDHGTDKNKRK